MAMRYPPEDESAGLRGSGQDMCDWRYRRELTLARLKTLRHWLQGVPEGDFCAGSIKHQRDLVAPTH